MRFRADWLAIASLLIAFAPAQADDLDAADSEAASESATASGSAAASGSGTASESADASSIPLGTVTAPAPEPDSSSGRRKLSLDAAIQLALENNLNVEVQRFGPLISAEDETIAWGIYDPEFFAEFGYQSNKTPNAFALNAATSALEKRTDGVGGFQGLIPLLGSNYNFSFTGSRTTTNSSIQSLSPELRSSFSLTLTQPLLRGFWWNAPWTRVKTTGLFHDQSLEIFRRDVMDIVQAVEDAYWNLIAREQQMNVQQKSLETAEALLEQSKVEYEVGVASKVKVVESEAGVAQREFELIVETNAFRNAQDILADLILGSRFTPDQAINVELTDKPDEYLRYEVDREEATQRAFEMRPELAIAQDQIDAQELEVKFAKNERLPQFDISLSYGNSGLAGDNNDNRTFGLGVCTAGAVGQTCSADSDCDMMLVNGTCGPPTPIPSTDFEDSLDDFIEHDAADQFTVRGMFTIPIPNTAPRARVSRSRLILRQLKTDKRRIEQSIILEIRKAVRDIASSQEGIEAARRATASETEQLRAERVRLEYGESTPFDVLQREEGLVVAQNREISAFQGYRTSLTALHRAQGTILRNRNIAIDAVLPVR